MGPRWIPEELDELEEADDLEDAEGLDGAQHAGLGEGRVGAGLRRRRRPEVDAVGLRHTHTHREQTRTDRQTDRQTDRHTRTRTHGLAVDVGGLRRGRAMQNQAGCECPRRCA